MSRSWVRLPEGPIYETIFSKLFLGWELWVESRSYFHYSGTRSTGKTRPGDWCSSLALLLLLFDKNYRTSYFFLSYRVHTVIMIAAF